MTPRRAGSFPEESEVVLYRDVVELREALEKAEIALQAMMIMSDAGHSPRKFDEALSWRENDEKAKALAIDACVAARAALAEPREDVSVPEKLSALQQTCERFLDATDAFDSVRALQDMRRQLGRAEDEAALGAEGRK